MSGDVPDPPLQDRSCTRCPLYENARNVCVPGEGDLNSTLLILGIAPGGPEDRTNRPFIGESGRLLRSMLLANGLATQAIPDTEVDPDGQLHVPLCRISNILRCRPPENRDPSAEELRNCNVYLESELQAMVNLRYVVVLGSLPMKSLGVTGSVYDLAGVPRKTVLAGRELTVIPAFHPAFVLRRQTYLSTWEAHWHTIRRIVNPSKESFAEQVGAIIYPNGLEGKDWRSL